MARILQPLNQVISYGALIFLLISTVAGSLTGKPLFMTAVRSESMSPTLSRGDLVLLWPVTANTRLEVGDILVFKVEEGSLRNAGWIIHRAVDGDTEQGFVTQGDNNDTTDQDRDANPRIRRENIAARAITIGSTPLHIPLLGYIPVWTEKVVDQPYILPGAAVLLLALAYAGHATQRKSRRRRRKSGGMGEATIYLVGGVSLFLLVAAAGLMLSQQYSFTYAVSSEGRAALMGSSIGQLMVGDTVERSLTTLENKRGRLPLVLAVSSNDPQVQLSHRTGILSPGEEIDLSMTITAEREGEYRTHIWVGLFYPILPPAIIQALATINYWLALAVVSLIPALPVFFIPVFDPSLRLQLTRGLRRHLFRLLPR